MPRTHQHAFIRTENPMILNRAATLRSRPPLLPPPTPRACQAPHRVRLGRTRHRLHAPARRRDGSHPLRRRASSTSQRRPRSGNPGAQDRFTEATSFKPASTTSRPPASTASPTTSSASTPPPPTSTGSTTTPPSSTTSASWPAPRRQAGCKGVLFDIEQYNHPLFHYDKQRDAKTKSWDEYAGQVRHRGRETMTAFQDGYPGLTVFLTFGYSLPHDRDRAATPAKLPKAEYGLLAPFLDGMLDAAEGRHPHRRRLRALLRLQGPRPLRQGTSRP